MPASSQLDALRAHVATRPAPGAAAGVRASTAPGASASSAPLPPVLVVGSGRGGAGTSVLAALLALSAAGAGRRVLLVDADEHVGPQRYLLGVAAGHAVADLRGGLPLEALPVAVSDTLTLVPGGPGLAGIAPSPLPQAVPNVPPDAAAAAAVLPPAERRALLRRVASLHAGHDLVIVDGGSRLDTVSACLEAAAPAGDAGSAGGADNGRNARVRLLVVTGADPIGLAASYALVKAAGQRAPLVETLVLANRLDEEAAAHAFAQLDAGARHFLERPLALAGAVPDDSCLDVALRAGMLLHDAAAGSPAAVAIQPIAERLFDPHRSPRPALSPSRDRADARDLRPVGGRPAATSIAALSYGLAR